MDPVLVRPRLQAIMADVFDSPSLVIADNMQASDIAGWDSLTHINLVVAVEREFGIRMTVDDVRNLSNVGDLISVVSKKAA
jgi:acyl carrier protein